jgi:hypothetical protein
MHEVVCKLYGCSPTGFNGEIVDISPVALEKTLHRRHNQARGFTITAPAGHELLTATADDGYPNLQEGDRKLIVWEDGEPVFHGRVFTVERNGDGQQNLATITAWDPRMEFGYEADERAGRLVRDETGNLITPTFVSSVDGGAAISGPDLIQQVLTNSMQTGTESDPNPGEGPMPISLTGAFDLDVPPAVDLSPEMVMDWPVMIGDFVNKLVETNVVDVDLRPVDPGEGFDEYVMAELSAVSRAGVDRTASVHFDYWTGDHNAVACRHVADFQTVCNKLYDYLGPRISQTRWKGLIPHGAVDPTASRARYGTFMQLRVFDSLGDENSARPLYQALWDAEMLWRIWPRRLLFITPAPDHAALFEAPADFDAADLVAINVGADFGLELAQAQRVYGYDKTWDRQGVARLSQLVTSADAE